MAWTVDSGAHVLYGQHTGKALPAYPPGPSVPLPASDFPPTPEGDDGIFSRYAFHAMREEFELIARDWASLPRHLHELARDTQWHLLVAATAGINREYQTAIAAAYTAGGLVQELRSIRQLEPDVQARLSIMDGSKSKRPTRRNPAVSWCVQTRKDWRTAKAALLFREWERFRKLAGKPEVSFRTFEVKLSLERNK